MTVVDRGASALRVRGMIEVSAADHARLTVTLCDGTEIEKCHVIGITNEEECVLGGGMTRGTSGMTVTVPYESIESVRRWA